MCGVIAILSTKPIPMYDTILDCLHKLEYRGYDSCGIACIDERHKLHVDKSVGNTQDLINKINATGKGKTQLLSKIGLGHTRWATNGKVTVENAHPHISNSICIVHNGIIENHEAIRKKLSGLGISFYGTTDTEVIAKLLDYNMYKGLKLMDAFKSCISELKGSYAIVAICDQEPNRILCCKKGPPLICGISTNNSAIYVSSDAISIPSTVNKLIYAEDGDIIDIIATNNATDDQNILMTFIDVNNNIVTRDMVENVISTKAISLGSFSNYMIKEIHEEVDVIRNAKHNSVRDELSKYKKVRFIACGTSYYAALLSSYYMEKYSCIHTTCEVASEFRYRNPVLEDDCLYVFISQSGETIDTLYALKMVKDRGYHTCAFVNQENSAIALEVDNFININAGTEICVASTKAFVAQFVSILMTFVRNKINLHSISAHTQSILEHHEDIKKLSDTIKGYTNIVFIGRCYHYAIALEASLKLKEISYINAQAYQAGEIKHGPIATVDSNMYSIIFAPQDDFFEKTITNAEEILARDGKLTIITNESARSTVSKRNNIQKAGFLFMPDGDEFAYPFYETLYVHLLSYYVASTLNRNVDKPRHLAKSVTVE